MFSFTVNNMSCAASDAHRAEANCACSARSFNFIGILMDISLLMSIFAALAQIISIIGISAVVISVLLLGLIICLLSFAYIFYRVRKRTAFM